MTQAHRPLPSLRIRTRSLWTALIAALGALGLAAAAAAQEQEPPQRTEAPYFVVEGAGAAADPLPLAATDVDFAISGVVADVTVRQVYTNQGNVPLSARYLFPASVRAAVTGLRMRVGNKVTDAVIQEREQAEQTYEAAKQEGKTASLLSQERPNVFSMRVANVMPGDRIEVELHYVETLIPEQGVYEFIYPTVVGPRYGSDATPSASPLPATAYQHEGETPPSTFAIAGHVESGIPLASLDVTSHHAIIDRKGARRAQVTLKPGREGDRDFILRYALRGKEVQSGLLLHEGEDGENYFLLTVEPPKRALPETVPPREYVFVLDVSGSMYGFPLDVAKGLIRELTATFRPQDTFNVMLFSGGSTVLWPRSRPATKANLKEALAVIDRHEGGGGTELLPALRRALSMEAAPHTSRSFIVVTDGYISAEREAFTVVREHLDEANLFVFGIGSSVNRFLVDGLARAGMGEPFVVTDATEAKPVAKRFQRYVATPVLTDIQVTFKDFDVYDLEPTVFPDLLAERPLVMQGKWRGPAAGQVTVSGFSGASRVDTRLAVADSTPDASHAALAPLWARARVTRISDFASGNETPEEQDTVTALGLRHHLLTRFTSFVAVLHEVRNTSGDSADVDQPQPLPLGVSDLAVGEAMYGAPEPDLSLLLALMLGLAGYAYVSRGRRGAP